MKSRRTWTRLVVAACIATGSILLSAAAAPAASANSVSVAVAGIPDCKSPPQTTFPTEGAIGDLDTGPTNPRIGDPFAKGASVSIYEVYGWGGLTWPDYDLGCGPGVVRDPKAVGAGSVADFLSKTLYALDMTTVQLNRWAMNPHTLALLDPFNIAAATGFGTRVFLPLFGFVLGIIGITVILRARHGDVRDASARGAWAIGVGIVGVAATLWPLAVAPAIDNALQSSVAYVSTTLASTAADSPTLPDALGANLQRANAYETWRRGMFGSNTEAADKYGPALFQAGTYSRDQVASMRKDPTLQDRLAKTKKADYKNVAAKVQDEYPDAYEYLSGSRNGDRVTAAIAGLVGFFASDGFVGIMSILLLFTGAVLRGVLAVLPLICLLAAHPRLQHILIGPINYLCGLMGACLAFGAAVAMLIAAQGGLLASGTNLWLVMVLMFAMSLAALVMLWPALKLVSPKTLKATVQNARQAADRAKRVVEAGRRRTEQDSGRRAGPIAPYADSSSHTSQNTFAGATPAEAKVKTTVVRAAITGAAQGAATSVIAGVLTGGTATLAAAGASAVKGTAANVATGMLGSRSSRALPAALGAGAHSPAPAEANLGSTPVSRSTTAPVRIYRPDEQSKGPTSAAPSRRSSGVVVHQISNIYTPVGSPS